MKVFTINVGPTGPTITNQNGESADFSEFESLRPEDAEQLPDQAETEAPEEKKTNKRKKTDDTEKRIGKLEAELKAERNAKKALEIEFDQMAAAHAEQIDKMARHIAEAKKARPTRKDLIVEAVLLSITDKIAGYSEILQNIDDLGPMTDALSVKLNVFDNLRKLRIRLQEKMVNCNEFLISEKDSAEIIFGENNFRIASPEFITGVLNAFNAGLEQSIQKVDAHIKTFKF